MFLYNAYNNLIWTCGILLQIIYLFFKFKIRRICEPLLWDIGHLCNCRLVKRSEDEEDFIRAARRYVLDVIQRRTCTHVGEQGTQGTSCISKAMTERIKMCGCLVLIFRCMYIYVL